MKFSLFIAIIAVCLSERIRGRGYMKTSYTKEEVQEICQRLLWSIESTRGAIKSIHGSIENGYGMNKKALKKDLSYQESCLTNSINYWKKELGIKTLTESVDY